MFEARWRTQRQSIALGKSKDRGRQQMIAVRHSRLASGVMVGYAACFIALAIGLFLSGSPTALAQSIYANLSGTVTDTSGAVVAGAKVSVQNSDTNVVRLYVTNGAGYFSATQLPTGKYNVTVEARGFEKWQGSGIVLQGADEKSLTIPLKVGAETET